MSISKQQAELLADGLLDDAGFGSDESLQPRETIAELLLLAAELVESAQENLNAAKANASGELSESIEVEEPKTAPGIIQVDVTMNFYGQFINKGVKGTRSGSGLYKFKTEFPGENMVKAFVDYQKQARSKIGSVKKHIGYENKNAAIAQKQSAYAMARATKQHGIKATYFMDLAIAETDEKVSERLGDALAIDVLNSLPDEL